MCMCVCGVCVCVCVCVWLVMGVHMCVSLYTGQPGDYAEVNQRTVKKEGICLQKWGRPMQEERCRGVCQRIDSNRLVTWKRPTSQKTQEVSRL